MLLNLTKVSPVKILLIVQKFKLHFVIYEMWQILYMLWPEIQSWDKKCPGTQAVN